MFTELNITCIIIDLINDPLFSYAYPMPTESGTSASQCIGGCITTKAIDERIIAVQGLSN